MKISYDAQIFCAQAYGGVSRYFCEIASRLGSASEDEVAIAAPLHINEYLEKISQDGINGFRNKKLPKFSGKYRRTLVRGSALLFSDLLLRVQAPDVIHETYYFPYPLGPRRARRVLTIYDMIHEKFPSDFPSGDKTARYKALAAGRADHIICISESTRRDVISYLGIAKEKISVIYLGYDLKLAGKYEYTQSSKFSDQPFLLYVGNRAGYKNFSALLNAYASSPLLRREFNLICFGGGSFTAEEKARVEKLGLSMESVLHMEGDDSFLAGLYSNASVFVYPSLYEGFGIPPLEAMSQNCPVVCSNNSSIPEVVGEAGEYFDASDFYSLRLAIERVVGSESRRNELVEKGRARLDKFSWDYCAEETSKVYRNLF